MIGQLTPNNTMQIDSKVKTDISAELEEIYAFEIK